MTAKRFTIDYDDNAINDNGEYEFDLDEFKGGTAEKVVEWLNALHEENQLLKEFIKSEFPKTSKKILEDLE